MVSVTWRGRAPPLVRRGGVELLARMVGVTSTRPHRHPSHTPGRKPEGVVGDFHSRRGGPGAKIERPRSATLPALL
eukprot:scaffold5977_cov103-Isochrysis_galbana.AAC.5